MTAARDPFPMFTVSVKDRLGQTAAETLNVAPASTEMACDLCHTADTMRHVSRGKPGRSGKGSNPEPELVSNEGCGLPLPQPRSPWRRRSLLRPPATGRPTPSLRQVRNATMSRPSASKAMRGQSTNVLSVTSKSLTASSGIPDKQSESSRRTGGKPKGSMFPEECGMPTDESQPRRPRRRRSIASYANSSR